jgi:hypothetical protein
VIATLVLYRSPYLTAPNVQLEIAFFTLTNVDDDVGIFATDIAYSPRKRSCPVYLLEIRVVLLKQSESVVWMKWMADLFGQLETCCANVNLVAAGRIKTSIGGNICAAFPTCIASNTSTTGFTNILDQRQWMSVEEMLNPFFCR